MLSRLFHDYYNPVYEYLLECEISPTLYAAPWFLTLFASHFPIGFVARVLGKSFRGNIFGEERFLDDCRKTDTKLLLLPITTGTTSTLNQSEFLAITRNLLKAREK